MAWYNSGNWDGLRIDTGLPNIMAEVCSAISERYTLLNATAPDWSIVGGTDKNPVANDFDGARIDDVLILTNIEQAQDAIETLLTTGVGDGRFLNPDTPGTAYITLSDMLDRGDYGSSWLAPVHASDVRPWIQIKDALDEMTQPCWGAMEIIYVDGQYRSSAGGWAATLAATPSPYSGSYALWVYGLIQEPLNNELKTSHISGSLVAGWWVGNNVVYNADYTNLLSVVLDGVTYESSDTGGSHRLYRNASPTWPQLSSNPTLYDSVESPPEYEPGGAGFRMSIGYDIFWSKGSAFVVGTRCVTDISTLLTDQQ